MVFMSFGRHPSCSKHFTWVRTCWQCFKIHLYYFSLQLLNGTSSITDRHYFSMRRVKIQRVTHCVAFKSLVPTNAYITTDIQGQVTLGARSRRDRAIIIIIIFIIIIIIIPHRRRRCRPPYILRSSSSSSSLLSSSS